MKISYSIAQNSLADMIKAINQLDAIKIEIQFYFLL